MRNKFIIFFFLAVIFFIVIILFSEYIKFSFSPRAPHFQKNEAFFNSSLYITNGKLGFLSPYIIQDKEDILYAMWIDEATTFLAKSLDKGNTWKKQTLSSGKQRRYEWWPFYFNKDSQGKLYLVQASNGIFFSHSNDKGKIWIDPVQVNDDTRKFAGCQNPAFTKDNEGTLYIIYIKKKKAEEIDPCKDDNKSSTGLYLSKSFNGGDSWGKNTLLKDIAYSGPTDFPSLISYKKDFYLAYGNFIYKSTNKGRNWEKILKLKSELGNIEPIIKNDLQGNLYLIWQKSVVTKDNTGFSGGEKKGYTDICFSKSINKGKSWARPVKINNTKLTFGWKMAPLGTIGTEEMKYLTQETRKAIPLDLAVSKNGKIIGIIWKDWRSGKGELYFSYSIDKGKNWSNNIQVNDAFASPMKAGSLIIKEDGSIYVLWTNLGHHEFIPGGFIGDVNIYFSSGNIKI